MAFLKPYYANETEIPPGLKEFYIQKGTGWELAQAGEEIAVYFNTGLAQNRDRFRAEKETAESERDRANAEVNRLTTLNQQQKTANDNAVARLTVDHTQELTKVQAELAKRSAPDSVVLTKDEAAEWTAVQTLAADLGKSILKAADIKTAIAEGKTAVTERDRLKSENDEHQRDKTITRAANIQKWNPEVLKFIVTHPQLGAGLDFKFRQEDTSDGKKEWRAFTVLTTEENGEKKTVERPALEHATEAWAAHLPALQAGAPAGNGDTGGATGTKLPTQLPSGGREKDGKPDKAKEMVDKFNADRDAAPNPLKKSTGAASASK